MKPSRDRTRHAAFSLIELLAVTAIAALLVMLLAPSLLERAEEGKRAQCINNLRQFFTHVREGGKFHVEPGLLWSGAPNPRVHQCPSFAGSANWLKDPMSGYNYNTSYIGAPSSPAHRNDIGNPAVTALFGDGEWAAGANKFMRSPRGSPADNGFSGRHAGTQGYRHLGKTDVAFVDGHAIFHGEQFTDYDGPTSLIAAGTGFLAPDNSLYDLE